MEPSGYFVGIELEIQGGDCAAAVLDVFKQLDCLEREGLTVTGVHVDAKYRRACPHHNDLCAAANHDDYGTSSPTDYHDNGATRPAVLTRHGH